MRIRLGTCSWTDPSLIQCRRFYPSEVTTSESRLRFYASIFPTVEVDSSYYALPSERNARLWAQRTPEEFTMHVKAFRLFTGHWAEASALPKELRTEGESRANTRGRLYLKDLSPQAKDLLWTSFRDALHPLHDTRKLGTVLFQFAPWVSPSRRVLEQIEESQARLPDYRLAVEFRNRGWFQEDWREEVLGFLREHRLTYVGVDEPQGFRSSVPPVVDLTGGPGYLRFHGRNDAAWEVKGVSAAERFDYYYSDQELAEWVPRIEWLGEQCGEVNVLFNTNRYDQGPQNARRLARLLDQAGLGAAMENRDAILALPEYGDPPT